MKTAYVLLALVGVSGLLGCNRHQVAAEKAVQKMRQSFDSAPEELKSKYQAVKAALESNDFPKAKAALDELRPLHSQLTPEQQGAVAEQKHALMLKASAAAQNGDPSAARVVQDLRLQSRSRSAR